MSPSNGPSMKVLGLTLLASLAVVASAHAALSVNCPFDPNSSGDLLDRGFYVRHYSAGNLAKVQIQLIVTGSGPAKVSLTPHLGGFGGPIVGTTQFAVAPGSGRTAVIFDFGGAAVAPDSTIAFVLKLVSGSGVFFNTGDGIGHPAACADVIETEDTAPPLSIFRRQGFGVQITSIDPGPCVADSTTLCLDANPGDRRFRVELTANTVQSGGQTLLGKAVQLNSVGINQGGLFYLFASTNPEVLVKVLPACAINDRNWIFISAGTNVGFTVNVFDTFTRKHHSYSNTDLHVAASVADTTVGLPCPI